VPPTLEGVRGYLISFGSSFRVQAFVPGLQCLASACRVLTWYTSAEVLAHLPWARYDRAHANWVETSAPVYKSVHRYAVFDLLKQEFKESQGKYPESQVKTQYYGVAGCKTQLGLSKKINDVSKL
jgi:hypothetical protein